MLADVVTIGCKSLSASVSARRSLFSFSIYLHHYFFKSAAAPGWTSNENQHKQQAVNVTCHYKMPLLKYLTVLIIAFMSFQDVAYGQSKSDSSEIDSATHNLRIYRQLFWDSLPKPVGHINDYENLYTDIEQYKLDSLIRKFEEKTTIQMAVITFDTTLTTSDNFDALTLRIANYWGVGRKERDNGVVIGISKGYRRIRIQNGYGIEKVLTDAETKQIIDRDFIPSFRESDYFEGTYKGLVALIRVLEERYK